MRSVLRSLRDEIRLPVDARAQRRCDRRGLPVKDPGADKVIREGIAWLGRAQDCSKSADGGVARDYSLVKGWATSYPETTGYIVPTLLNYARREHDNGARARARRMLDWLISIQFADGGFQGGRIDSTPIVPVTFNTGQILLGLAAGASEFGEPYRSASGKAARWLVDTQDPDGCWRRYPTPFANPGEKAYETHVAWGLFEAERIEPSQGFAQAGLANVLWALHKQRENGWVADCCLSDPTRPLTHTLGYFLRGLIEAYRFSRKPSFLHAARKTADGLLQCLGEDGRLPGRLAANWRPAADWVCLTGSVQIAICWFMLFRYTGEQRYLAAGTKTNEFVRRSIQVDAPLETRGALKGSFPIDGEYGQYEYPNWATKFCIDSNTEEASMPG